LPPWHCAALQVEHYPLAQPCGQFVVVSVPLTQRCCWVLLLMQVEALPEQLLQVVAPSPSQLRKVSGGESGEPGA